MLPFKSIQFFVQPTNPRFLGPATYCPRVDVEVVTTIEGLVIEHGTALHLRAIRSHFDETAKKQRNVRLHHLAPSCVVVVVVVVVFRLPTHVWSMFDVYVGWRGMAGA